MWLSGTDIDTSRATIVRLDRASGAVQTAIDFDRVPCESSAYWEKALWTATCSPAGVAKIDATTNKTVAFSKLDVPEELDQEASIGAGEGGVWLVVNGPDCVQCLVAHLDRDLELQVKIPVTAGAAAVEVGLGRSGPSIKETGPSPATPRPPRRP